MVTTNQKLLLKISYHGASFQGWQSQPNGCGVADKIQDALKILYKKEIKIAAASRTDAGVHAKEQLGIMEVENTIPIYKLIYSLNALTPPQISIFEIIPISQDFHLRKQIQRKKYCYQIYNSPAAPALFAEYYWYIKKKLHLEKMKKAAQILVGTHDFQTFCSSSCESKSTQKTIFYIQWDIQKRTSGDAIFISFEGSGFLKQMIRIIVGALVEIGLEKEKTTLLETALKTNNPHLLKWTAPAKGLFLEKIFLKK